MVIPTSPPLDPPSSWWVRMCCLAVTNRNAQSQTQSDTRFTLVRVFRRASFPHSFLCLKLARRPLRLTDTDVQFRTQCVFRRHHAISQPHIHLLHRETNKLRSRFSSPSPTWSTSCSCRTYSHRPKSNGKPTKRCAAKCVGNSWCGYI